MSKRLQTLGMFLMAAGLFFAAVGGFAYYKVVEGTASLDAFSAAQGVELTYNADGQLLERGETAGAEEIMALLTDDWGYPVVAAELDPADPIVNTASEYMYQMATIAYHTLHGTQTVVLDEDFTAPDGTLYRAGEPYDVAVNGRYWADFDHASPVDAAVRGQAWTGTAHALIGELGVGTVTAQALTLGLALAALAGGLGGTLLLTGAGLVWASRARREV